MIIKGTIQYIERKREKQAPFNIMACAKDLVSERLIQQCSEREIESFRTQFKLLEGTISEPSKQINLVLNMISELVHKWHK